MNSDDAEVCKLVTLYILHIFREKWGKQKIGLSHDDRSVSFEYTSRPQTGRVRKDFIAILRKILILV